MYETLDTHHEVVDQEAIRLYDWPTEEMAKRENITKTLKAKDYLEQVRRSNAIWLAAKEVVRKEWIKNLTPHKRTDVRMINTLRVVIPTSVLICMLIPLIHQLFSRIISG